MSTYHLSIVVYGPGEDPNYPSRWALVFHHPHASEGNMLQVIEADHSRQWYQLDRQNQVPIFSPYAEGRFSVASFSPLQYSRSHALISDEPPPANGRDGPQDWVLNCLVSLETEELVPPGRSEWLSALLGLSAKDLAISLGAVWIPNGNRRRPSERT